MFDTLSDRLGSVFDRLRGRGALGEADVRAAMREVRVALLEADVALPVARDFVDRVTEKAVGQEVLRSVTPGQMVVKIVHDALVETLGSETAELNLAVNPPAVIMMVGLQGSGKTTTTAKLAKRLSERERKKVLIASLDVARPAAQEQLAVLGRQAEVDTLPAGVGEAIDKLEAFHPERVAGRILGMGDVVSLVERAAETIQVEDAEKLAAKMAKGKFDLDDLWAQLRQMQRMGGLGALAGMMPGLKGMKGAIDQAQDGKALVHMEAMLSSMTAKERAKPELINAKRKIRVAKGSGTTVQEINKLLKMHQEMATAMKRLKKMGGFGKLAAMFSKGGLEGALGGIAPPGALPQGGLPGLGGGGLPGLGGSPFNLPP